MKTKESHIRLVLEAITRANLHYLHVLGKLLELASFETKVPNKKEEHLIQPVEHKHFQDILDHEK